MKQEYVGKVIDRSFNAQSFIDTHAVRITDHYLHAREKHPYFCDNSLMPIQEVTRGQLAESADALENARATIVALSEVGNLDWFTILECELHEVFDALWNSNKAQAVEELYDCIAICLRAIDVLEGRQKLGKPQTISGNEAEK